MSAAVEFYNKSEIVDFASWVFVGGLRSKDLTPNTEPYWTTQQSYMNSIQAPTAWDTTQGSRDVTIVVMDTGVDLDHDDLAVNLATDIDRDFVSREAPDADGADDTDGHGTFVAGLIGAVGDNGIGITGLNWRIRIVPIRIMGIDGRFVLQDVLNALDYVRTLPNVVAVNMSFGRTYRNISSEKVAVLERSMTTLEGAFSNNILYVIAAPNENLDMDNCSRTITANGCFDFPTQLNAPYKLVISSIDAATSQRNTTAAYGQNTIDLFAPGMDSNSLGGNLWSTLSGNSYGGNQGTSFATALVTGTIALRAAYNRQNNVQNTPGALRDAILRSVRVDGLLSGLCRPTCGRLDVAAALTVATQRVMVGMR